MNKRDPHGYYARLGLPPTASAREIKEAFRRKAKDLHPDRNRSPEATRDFRLLNEAYNILKNPAERARYDTLAMGTSRPVESAADEPAPSPIACSSCGRVTAQPRYIIFYEVKSFLIVTLRTPIQGIFCSACAEKKVLRASLVTWLLGWWGFPWGLIYSFHALFRNLLGGLQPADVNTRLLSYQSWVFARTGQIGLARAMATNALALAQKVQAREARNDLSGALHALLRTLDDGTPVQHLKDRWSALSRATVVQGAFACACIVGLGMLAREDSTDRESRTIPVKEKPTGKWDQYAVPEGPAVPPTPSGTSPSQARANPEQVLFDHPLQDLPRTGIYSRRWEHHPGEILAPLRIVTPEYGYHYYVKVVDWQQGTLGLTLFIRSGDTANVRLPLGSYRIKYASGTDWYGTKYLFGPTTAYAQADKRLDFVFQGDRVWGHTIELILQPGGNLRVTAISPEDF